MNTIDNKNNKYFVLNGDFPKADDSGNQEISLDWFIITKKPTENIFSVQFNENTDSVDRSVVFLIGHIDIPDRVKIEFSQK